MPAHWLACWADTHSCNPPLIKKLIGPLAALVALGAAANVILAWLSAGSHALDLGRLLMQPAFYLAIVLALVPWLTNTLRVSLWSRFLGRPLPWPDALRIVLANDIGSAITPTAAGGGYFKLGLLVERGFSTGTAASLMILGSLEDQIFFALAIPTTLVVSAVWRLPALQAVGNWLRHYLMVPALIVGVAIAIVFLARRPLARRLGRVWHDFLEVYRLIADRGRRRFAAALALAAVQWTCRFSATAVVLACIGAPVDPVLVFVLQWVIYIATLVVPTPGGMVGAEAAFYFAFGGFMPSALLPAAVASWRLLTFYGPLGLAACVFALLQRGWRPLASARSTGALGAT